MNIPELILKGVISLVLIYAGFMSLVFPERVMNFYLSAMKSKRQSFLSRMSEDAIKSRRNKLNLRFSGAVAILFGIVTLVSIAFEN